MRKKHNPAAIAGWCIILAFCLIAIFADFIAPYDPSELGTAYLKPSAEHLLGTNDLGQDIFSEMVTAHACRCCSACFPHCWFR